jgi:hypothetical protein
MSLKVGHEHTGDGVTALEVINVEFRRVVKLALVEVEVEVDELVVPRLPGLECEGDRDHTKVIRASGLGH